MREGGRAMVWTVAGAVFVAGRAAAVPLIAHPPAGDPTSWFSTDSYPAEAMRRGEHGRVAATLSVDAAGRVTSCIVRVSSGSAVLDTGTCAIATADRRVHPARDAQGRAIAATMPLAVRWQLPTDDGEPAPSAHGHRSWFGRIAAAHDLLLIGTLGWAFAMRRVRRLLGWGVFDDDGSEARGDRLPRRRRHRTRIANVTLAVAPVLALSGVLMWLGW